MLNDAGIALQPITDTTIFDLDLILFENIHFWGSITLMLMAFHISGL